VIEAAAKQETSSRSAEVLGEVRGKLVEVVCQLNLATQRSEGIRYGTAALHCNQSRHRVAAALNDNLLAVLGEINKPRQLAPGFMYSDSDHGQDDSCALVFATARPFGGAPSGRSPSLIPTTTSP
jgi:hypothetical protein